MTLNLCGKSVDCWNTSTFLVDPTDPDIVGIGILVSFVTTGFLAIVTLIAAFVDRGLPREQYNSVDQKIIAGIDRLFRRRTDRAPGPSFRDHEMTKYQAFLLSIGSQVLVTGIGMIIAIWAQICSITLLSFQIGTDLVFFTSTVHLATLTALRAHFQRHKHQRRLRVSVMLFQLVAFLFKEFIQYLTWDNSPWAPEACAIVVYEHHENRGRVIWDWLAFAALLTWSYHDNIKANLRRDRLTEDEEDSYPICLTLGAYLSRDPKFNGDRDAYIRERNSRELGTQDRKLRELQVLLDCNLSTAKDKLRLLHIADLDIYTAVAGSLFNDVLGTAVWMGLAVVEFVSHLRYEGVSLTPLMEWKYGEIMPVALLLVYAVNAMEAGNSRFPS